MDDFADLEDVDYGALEFDEVQDLDKEISLESDAQGQIANDNAETEVPATQVESDQKATSTAANRPSENTTPAMPTTYSARATSHGRYPRHNVQSYPSKAYASPNMPMMMLPSFPNELPSRFFDLKRHTTIHVNPRYIMEIMQISTMEELEYQRRQLAQQQQSRRQDTRVQKVNVDAMFGAPLSRTGDKRRLNETGQRGLSIKGVASDGISRHLGHNNELNASAAQFNGQSLQGRNATPPATPKLPKSKVLVTNLEGVNDDDITALARKGFGWLNTERTDKGIAVTFWGDDDAKLFRRQFDKHKMGDNDVFIRVQLQSL